jgi:hypothetical protein
MLTRHVLLRPTPTPNQAVAHFGFPEQTTGNQREKEMEDDDGVRNLTCELSLKDTRFPDVSDLFL